MPSTLSDDIDNLLLRYLELADQYTILREELNVAQSSFGQNIARANLAPNRGISRYGADRYDGRMQASRLCRINALGSESEPQTSLESSTSVPTASLEFTTIAEAGVDPIRMFAVLPPPTLRSAQKDAVNMVSTIPKLVSVDQEMKEIEIRIRRARKYKLREEEAKVKGTNILAEDGPAVEQLLEGVRKTAIV